MNDKYIEEGFEDRNAYLIHLCEKMDIPLETVFGISDILGMDEDFGKLPLILEFI